MKSNRGYILFELVIALSILSGLLLFSQQWLLQQQKRQGNDFSASAAQQFLAAIETFWLAERRTPATLAELVSKGYVAQVWQPWPGEWSIEQYENMLRLRLAVDAGSAGAAQRLSEQVAGAHVTRTGEFMMHVFEPVQLALYKRYLHRYPDAFSPEYNQMQTHLDMNGFSLTNVNEMHANQLISGQAIITEASFENVQATRLEVDDLQAQRAFIGGHNIAQVAQRLKQLQNQWITCRANGGCQ